MSFTNPPRNGKSNLASAYRWFLDNPFKDPSEFRMITQRIHQSDMNKILRGPLVGINDVHTIWVDDLEEKKPMNKFAPVAPIHIYEAMANRGYVPDTILLLAHDVVKSQNIHRYHNLFNHGAWQSTTIIMDNSLIELGGAVDLEMVKNAVEVVEADVVVLPDSLTDGPASAHLTLESFDQFKTVFDPKGVELMAVIQGETMPGFMRALHMLHPIADLIEWISIPRRTESKFGYHRTALTKMALRFFPDAKIHLLGFSDYPWEDLWAAQNPRVMSIDSAAPLRDPEGYVMVNTGGPRVSKGDAGEPIDWWDQARYEDFMLDNIQKINQFIGG